MNSKNRIIADIRQFNRFYTNILGLLDKHVLDTGYSFTEARVILEIGFLEECIANHLVENLEIDRSYMSRILNKLRKDDLIDKELSTRDNRTSIIRLTAKGIALFQQLNEKSDQQIVKLLQNLTQEEIKEIHVAMLFLQQKLQPMEDF